MLNENEKEQIRLEEQYRLEVRNQLEDASQKKSSAAWSFLNSSLGLWLLSAILISGAGFLYTHWQNARTEERDNNEAIQKLDSEISYRYSQILIKLYNLTDPGPNGKFVLRKNPKKEPSDVRTVLELTYQQPKGDAAFLYPEFASTSIPGLIVELKRRVKTESERRELDRILAAVTGGIFEGADFSNVPLMAQKILEGLMLPRWKKGYFYFTDCPASNPFC